MLIQIDIPDYRLDENIWNGRGGQAARAASIRMARELGEKSALGWIDQNPGFPTPRPRDFSVQYIVRGDCSMDEDHAMTALKPLLNGIKDAGVIPDDFRVSRWTLTLRRSSDFNSVSVIISDLA